MILGVLVLAAGLASDSTATSMPVRLHNRTVHRGPNGRLRAVPMDARATIDSLADRYSVWMCPDPGNNLRAMLTRFGSRADSNSGMLRLQISTPSDSEGLRYKANPDSFESVEPDTSRMCMDLNGDGHPDFVIRIQRRELPLTGQWVDVVGSCRGKVRAWCTRRPGWVPKSLVEFANEARPLVWVIEPHTKDWPYLRDDPPARDRLFLLADSQAVEVSSRHPEWYAAALALSGQSTDARTSARQFDLDWVTPLLQHTWILLTTGQKDAARLFFDGRMSRAEGMNAGLRKYLLGVRAELAAEWTH